MSFQADISSRNVISALFCPNIYHRVLPASGGVVREDLAGEREGADGEGDSQAGHDPQEMGGRQRFGTPLKDNVE